MIAFHNDQTLKTKYVNRVLAHQKADEIIHGQYWTREGKGCAVGCTIHSSDHSAYEKELGIPQWMARLEDRIFEGLPDERSKEWPLEFLQAITPGQDLEKIKIPMLIFIVESARSNFDHKKYPKQLLAIDIVLTELRKTPIDNAKTRDAAAAAAAAAADAYAAHAHAHAHPAYADAYAAYYAAAAAAYADAAYAADAADAAAEAAYADAYAEAAYADAYAADAYAARRSARNNAYVKFADKLLELIRENK